MDFLSRLKSLKVYRKKSDRAPHKPLYLLYLLSGAERGEVRLKSFSEIEAKLSKALRLFGKKAKVVHPEYPFWRIQNDQLGEVIPTNWDTVELRKGNSDPRKSALVARKACGGLLSDDYRNLSSSPELIRKACHQILDDHFPISLHEDIMYFFGFSFGSAQAETLGHELGDRRCEAFDAYQHRCAISGYQASPQLEYAGLEFAEILWLNHGGAVHPSNFIAMSTLHRKLFHLGAFTLDEAYRIRASAALGDQPTTLGIEEGKKIHLPEHDDYNPSQACLQWHRTKVFKG